MKSHDQPPLNAVLESHKADWMKTPGVIGVGEGRQDGKPAIMILVDTLTPQLRRSLPEYVEGYSVMIEETGVVRALDK